MSLTVRERDRQARSAAQRYLAELSAATCDYAAPDNDGWFTAYALGFVTGHVAFALALARHRHALRWFYRWPQEQHVEALVMDLVPNGIGLERARFTATYEPAARVWGSGDPHAPINIGGGMGDRVLRASFARTEAAMPLDYFGAKTNELDVELRRLRAPTWLGRLTGYRSGTLIYRYMVMRTLGETVFGLTKTDADRLALQGI